MAYESPQLSLSEIVTAFKEYNVDVSENDFRSPDVSSDLDMECSCIL